MYNFVFLILAIFSFCYGMDSKKTIVIKNASKWDIRSVGVTRDNKIVTASGKKIKLWHIGGSLLKTIDTKTFLHNIVVTKKDRIVFIGKSGVGYCDLVENKVKMISALLFFDRSRICSIDDDKFIFLNSGKSVGKLENTTDGFKYSEIKSTKNWIYDLSLTRDNSFVLYCNGFLEVLCFSGKILKKIKLSFDSVQGFEVTRENEIVVGYLNDGLEKFDMKGKSIAKKNGNEGNSLREQTLSSNIRCLCITKLDKIVTAHSRCVDSLVIWNSNLEVVETMEVDGYVESPIAICETKDGKIVTGERGGDLFIWQPKLVLELSKEAQSKYSDCKVVCDCYVKFRL